MKTRVYRTTGSTLILIPAFFAKLCGYDKVKHVDVQIHIPKGVPVDEYVVEIRLKGNGKDWRD